MKRLIVILCLLSAASAGGGDYARRETRGSIIETRGAVTTVTRQRESVSKIAEFAERRGLDSALATEFGRVISSKRLPKGFDAYDIAAIAARESDFRPWAVGSDGERSAFQILEWPKDKNPLDINASVDEAIRTLNEKLEDSHGDKWGAVERYNGAGEKARLYVQDIKRLKREIQNVRTAGRSTARA